jgi:hypothetical protein
MLPSFFSCDPTALADQKLTTCMLLPPPAAFDGIRSLTALDCSPPVKWMCSGCTPFFLQHFLS